MQTTHSRSSIFSSRLLLSLGSALGIILAIIWLIPAGFDSQKYEQGMDQFYANEEKVSPLYASLQQAYTQEISTQVHEKGIPAWKQNIEILKELEQLENLPEAYQRENQLLRSYCQLRLEVFSLMDKALREGTDQYEAQIHARHEEIEVILNKLAE